MFGVALDLGTSGFRGQAVDLETGRVLSTVITSRHPLPGANVMDHLNFAVDIGLAATHNVVINAVNQLIRELGIPVQDITRVAVCGNPIQLSLFEEIEIRDLAYAGERKKRALGVVPPNRDGKRIKAAAINGLALPAAVEVLIPPAVKHEIGADALAMMVLSNLLQTDEISLVTDYGTNAEMALKVGDQILTGSCAAGPALEGQHIQNGMLAAPGAIADISVETEGYRQYVLDDRLDQVAGALVHPETGVVVQHGGYPAVGITGTGVVALLAEGMRTGLVRLPRVDLPGGCVKMGHGISFSGADLVEAGKAIGALRAGYVTLAKEAGIKVGDISCAYMAGASGTYVDALKAFRIGMVPPGVQKIYQIGNTSLSMAREMVKDPAKLEELQELALKLRAKHCMFGMSRDFANAYLLELSFWSEGMPKSKYDQLSRAFRLPDLPAPGREPEVVRLMQRDIYDIGPRGLKVIKQVGPEVTARMEGCTGCGQCVEECPEKALVIVEESTAWQLRLMPDRCNGTACRRCERKCPEAVFALEKLFPGAP